MDLGCRRFKSPLCVYFLCMLSLISLRATAIATTPPAKHGFRNAYATIMYMGTPRDYEFYIATRVMLRSLRHLRVDADLLVIASKDVPRSWIKSLYEDGAKVVSVDNIDNPYKYQPEFDKRFTLTLNKLYAWSLVEYDRVVMLDSDNLFLQNTDELFQCGQFCAVFINPCIFHTGLFVLQPSEKIFNDMLYQLANGRENNDGADQGFLVGYFDDMLDKPMFYPKVNGSKLSGFYRLPLGYQMDASYYYLKLRWSVPCGPNSVITFPSAPWLKPWYWWSWPVLPLGLSWHEQRRRTIGYAAEIPVMVTEALLYIIIMGVAKIAAPSFPRHWFKRPEKGCAWYCASVKAMVVLCIAGSYLLPCIFVPITIHPLLGWGLYLVGSVSLVHVVVNAFQLPIWAALTPWIGIVGVLAVMAFPLYSNGIVRALSVFAYAFLAAPFLWASILKVMASMDLYVEREPFFSKVESPRLELTKLC